MKKKYMELRLKEGIANLLVLEGSLYRFDVGADVYLSKKTASISKRVHKHRRGFPDLLIFEPSGYWKGMALELKVEGTRLYKRNGEPASEHIAEQIAMLKEFRKRGWCSGFVRGGDEFLKVWKSYKVSGRCLFDDLFVVDEGWEGV